MPNQLYTQWTEILTDYEPTSGQLLDPTEDGRAFCCLGVACEVSQLGEWMDNYYSAGGQADDAILPIVVRDALQLADCNGSFDYRELSTELIEQLNIALKQSHNMLEGYTEAPTMSEVDSLAQLNDDLAVHPNVFTLIQAVLKDQPPSLFNVPTTPITVDNLIVLLEETLVE